jgi:hypothetical protein
MNKVIKYLREKKLDLTNENFYLEFHKIRGRKTKNSFFIEAESLIEIFETGARNTNLIDLFPSRIQYDQRTKEEGSLFLIVWLTT